MSDLPLRMNLVEIKIAQLRMSHTTIDSVYKEVVGKESRKTVILEGQDKRFRQSQLRAKLGGDETVTAGHLVFKKDYLDNMDVHLRKGDRILEIAGEPVNYDIEEVRYESPLRGKNLLVYVEYREPKERSSR